MKDFPLTVHNMQKLMDALQDELKEAPVLIVSSQSAGTGKWGMARLWRTWMTSTAKFMAGNGVTMPQYIEPNGTFHGSRPFNSNDAHELFTSRWLPMDENGERLSWSRSGQDGRRAANKGERYIAMMRHEEWACNKGILLLKPRDSEYEKTRLEQEQ